jgi:hypothetical protein
MQACLSWIEYLSSIKDEIADIAHPGQLFIFAWHRLDSLFWGRMEQWEQRLLVTAHPLPHQIRPERQSKIFSARVDNAS